jgi:hypothetical protein
VEKTEAFEGVAWFKDEFGLFLQNSRTQKRYTAPEALFNLDEGLRKTIHDHHEGPQNDNSPDASAGTPPRAAHGKTKSAVGMVDVTGNTRDFASQMSSSSSLSEDDSSSGNKGLHSNASNNNEMTRA